MNSTQKFENVIKSSIKDHNLEKLNSFLASTPNTSEVLSSKTVLVLINILKKERKYADKTLQVNCVLSCLEHFVDVDRDSQRWDQVAVDISKLCELVFAISSLFIKDEALVRKNIEVIMKVAENIKSSVLVDNMIRYMLASLLKTLLSDDYENTKLLLMNFIGFLLQESSRETRQEILPPLTSEIERISNYVLLCGDYETQVAVLEILARGRTYIEQSSQEVDYFSDFPEILGVFKKYSFLSFDSDCRMFLNEVNASMGGKQLVFSVPCMVVSADNARLKKPVDPAYVEFWVDFNAGTRSISFYYTTESDEGWELMNVPEVSVLEATGKDSKCRSRSGEVIDAVKIELNLNTDTFKLPNTLRIYPRKTSTFEKFEKTIIRTILGKKYKSEISYAEVSRTVVREEPVPQTRSITRAVNESSGCNRDTFTEISVSNPPQLPDSVSENNGVNETAVSDVEKKKVLVHKESDNESDISSNSGNEDSDYDSFAQHVKQLKKQQECCKNNAEVVEVRDTDDELCNTSVQAKTAESNIKLENPQLSVQDVVLDNTMSLNGKPLKLSNGKCSTSQLVPDNQDSRKPQITKSNSVGAPIMSIKSQQESSNCSVTLRKKRLYSCENIDTKDLVMSSQDKSSLSADVPAYKITKREHKVKPVENVNRKNISYSYISSKENKKSEVKSTTRDNIYLDLDAQEQQTPKSEKSIEDSNMKGSPSTKFKKQNKYFIPNVEQKLLDLNKTPDGANKFFAVLDDFRDFSSPDRNCAKKTYSRIKKGTKPKKGTRRKRIIPIPSDSDSDFVPEVKMRTPPQTEVCVANTRSRKGFVDMLPRKVDPIRDRFEESDSDKLDVSMENLEEPEIKSKNIEVSPLASPESAKNTCKQKGSKKTVVKKGKKETIAYKTAQTKKATKQIKKQSEDHITVTTEAMDIVQYEPPVPNLIGSEDPSLDFFSQPVPQNKALLKMPFTYNDMLQFGKCCMVKTSNDIRQFQNLAQKERDMNYAKFDFETQAEYNAMREKCHKMAEISSDLVTVHKSLLQVFESNIKNQQTLTTEIELICSKLEEAKSELVQKNAKADKSESAQTASIVQKMVRGLKSFVLSFAKSITNRNSIEN